MPGEAVGEVAVRVAVDGAVDAEGNEVEVEVGERALGPVSRTGECACGSAARAAPRGRPGLPIPLPFPSLPFPPFPLPSLLALPSLPVVLVLMLGPPPPLPSLLELALSLLEVESDPGHPASPPKYPGAPAGTNSPTSIPMSSACVSGNPLTPPPPPRTNTGRPSNTDADPRPAEGEDEGRPAIVDAVENAEPDPVVPLRAVAYESVLRTLGVGVLRKLRVLGVGVGLLCGGPARAGSEVPSEVAVELPPTPPSASSNTALLGRLQFRARPSSSGVCERARRSGGGALPLPFPLPFPLEASREFAAPLDAFAAGVELDEDDDALDDGDDGCEFGFGLKFGPPGRRAGGCASACGGELGVEVEVGNACRDEERGEVGVAGVRSSVTGEVSVSRCELAVVCDVE
ncbi:hypothetical protein B0H16DRAFT_1502673 [Mycena metata]|uniref:Uncharacterized protein n=1 Tax=Mycena metata TaxID=1033252 RepID=A0AAD7NWS4_9AGAR|nr:hypothetical protein B0H16DRAFT_1502673 [Mycena metata]